MSISRSEVLKIAELAKLEFSEQELEAFASRFERILDYIETLKEVDIAGVEPTSHAAPTEGAAATVFRDDSVHGSFSVGDALANAPDPGGGHFRVPKVI